MTKTIYLDHAAATPVDKAVLAAMLPYFSEKFYNPSAEYLGAKAVRKDIESARSSVASLLDVQHSEIIFTAGGTEANNLAIHGVMSQYPDANMILSAIEHNSVRKPASQYQTKELPVHSSGVIKIEQLEQLIDEETVLVSIMYANHEVGTIQLIAAAGKIIKAMRAKRKKTGNTRPLYLHTDACQAANYLSLRVKRFGVDMMTLNGGKIYGPKQSGALFVHKDIPLRPQMLGGGQERGLRSGTENVAQIIGFAKALEIAYDMGAKEAERLDALRLYARTELTKVIPGTIINASEQRAVGADASQKLKKLAIRSGYVLPNSLHVTFPGQDNERLMMQLDESGIICAVGSACSASSEEASHVLNAMGLSENEAHASLRFTMGRSTTKHDIDRLVETLAKLVAS